MRYCMAVAPRSSPVCSIVRPASAVAARGALEFPSYTTILQVLPCSTSSCCAKTSTASPSASPIAATLDIAAFSALEAERRAIQTRTEEPARRNSLSKQIGAMKGKGEDTSAVMAEVGGIGDEMKAGEAKLGEIQARLSDLMLGMPNVAHESVPVGRTKPTTSRCAAGARRASSISR